MNQKMMDTKVFKVLSYVFIFWIIGLISPYRNEKDVKFHVGQGMSLTIFIIGLFILVIVIDEVLVSNLFVNVIIESGANSGKYIENEMGSLIGQLLRGGVLLLYILFDAIGIINVIKEREKALPIIGRYSFISKKL